MDYKQKYLKYKKKYLEIKQLGGMLGEMHTEIIEPQPQLPATLPAPQPAQQSSSPPPRLSESPLGHNFEP